MKNLAPAFQFYASDYLADVNVELLTLEQEGAYIRLLAYCWREGSLPAEPEQLAKLCKGCSTDVITVVQRLFNEAPSDKTRLVHKRLDEERQKQKERREQRSEAGKMSADARKGRAKSSKDPTAVATVVDSSLNETSTLQSSSSPSTNQLAGGLADVSEGTIIPSPSINPSAQQNVGGRASTAREWPQEVLEVYRHFPIKAQDERSLEAIQDALATVSYETLLSAVKTYATEVERTNTQNPTWASKWFQTGMWKSYVPVVESPASESTTENDQDLSPFPADFYQNLNRNGS